MAKTETKQFPLGGLWQVGHPSSIPEGFNRRVFNFLLRSGPRMVKRPPFKEDTVNVTSQGTAGFALWDDDATGVQRVVAFNRNAGNVDLFLKASSSSSETWTLSGAGSTAGFSVLSYANYRGKLYYVLKDEATGTGPVMSFQGSAQTANALGGETLHARTIAAFIDRLFIGHVKAVVTNELGTTDAYDPTTWTTTTTTTTTITNGSSVTGRITPTATTLSQIFRPNKYTVAASTTDTNLIYRFDLRNTSPTYPMPMRGEIYYSQVWVADTVMAVGAIRVPTTSGGNGFRYRVTAIAGDFKTAPVTEPTWPTTVGSTVVDDQVTWICDGPDTIGSTPTTIPTLTDEATWTPNWVRATIPPMPASAGVGVRLKFGTEASPTIQLAAIDFSFKDGLADGAVGKANKGHQLTVGRFQHPFINRQSTATATITLDNDIYWTETSDPNAIDGNNFWNLSEAPGPVTAMAVLSGRLLVFKQQGMWIFQGSADPNNPLIKERFIRNVGSGIESVAVMLDRAYFSDRSGLYEYEPGGEPTIIDTATRQYVSSLGTPSGYLAVDTANRELWVSGGTQSDSSIIFVYNYDTRQWVKFGSGLVGAFGVSNFAVFAPDRDTMYFDISGFEHYCKTGVAGTFADRDATDTAIVASMDMPIRPLVPQTEQSVDAVTVHYYTSASTQDADGMTISVTDVNNDNTLGTSQSFTLSDTTDGFSQRARSSPRATGQLMLLHIEHSGDGGEDGLTIHGVEADIRTVGRQRNMSSTEGNV